MTEERTAPRRLTDEIGAGCVSMMLVATALFAASCGNACHNPTESWCEDDTLIECDGDTAWAGTTETDCTDTHQHCVEAKNREPGQRAAWCE